MSVLVEAPEAAASGACPLAPRGYLLRVSHWPPGAAHKADVAAAVTDGVAGPAEPVAGVASSAVAAEAVAASELLVGSAG